MYALVTPTMTVAAVKAALAKQFGYHFKDISLMLGEKTLKNSQKLADSGINESSSLELRLLGSLTVRVISAGEEKLMDMNPRETVECVKALLTWIDFSNMELMHNGELLEGKRTLEFYHVSVDSKLEVLPRSQALSLSVVYQSVRFQLKVAASATVYTLKTLVARSTGLQPSLQKLFCDKHRLKESTRTMLEYGVSDQATIIVHVGSVVPLTVKLPNDEKRVIVIEKNASVGQLQAKVQDILKLPHRPTLHREGIVLSSSHKEVGQYSSLGDIGIVQDADFTISVAAQGEILMVVDQCCRVELLKQKLEKAALIPVQRQLLLYEGRALENGTQTLEEYGVSKGAKLLLLRNDITITVVSERRNLPFSVTLETTVLQLKGMIAAELNIPVSKQQITYNSKPLGNAQSLSHYGVSQGAELSVVESKDIVLVCRGREIGVNLADKVGSVRETSEMSLVGLNGSIVDQEQTFGEVGARTGDELFFVSGAPMDIAVSFRSGRGLAVSINPNCSFLDLKKKIEQAESIPVSKQILVWDQRVFPDSTSLRAIKDEPSLELFYSIDHIYTVSTVDRISTAVVFNTGEETVADLKKEVENRWEVPNSAQVLLLEDQILEDETVLSTLPRRGITMILNCEFIVYANVIPQKRRIRLILHEETTIQMIKDSPLFAEVAKHGDIVVQLDGETLPNSTQLCELQFAVTFDLFASNTLTLTVTAVDNTMRSVEVGLNDTVAQLRAKLDLPQSHALLIDGEMKKEDETLRSLGVARSSEIRVYNPSDFVPISFLSSSKELSVCAPRDASIATIKSLVFQQYLLPKRDQRYVYDGQVLSDRRPAPQEGHMTLLLPGEEVITVRSTIDSRTAKLIVRDTTTEEELLKEITPLWGAGKLIVDIDERGPTLSGFTTGMIVTIGSYMESMASILGHSFPLGGLRSSRRGRQRYFRP